MAAFPLFKDESNLLGHLHREEFFNDYERQPLLPKQLSQLGPGVGWLDLDGDGRDELLVGTGKGGTLGVYRWNVAGKFERVPFSKEWAAPDDTAGLAAWATPEGERGIVVGMARYEAPEANRAAVFRVMTEPNSRQLAVTEFAETRQAGSSAGPLAVADFDGDGDLDLFVGGRVVPGAYPSPAGSQMFRQNSGKLSLDAANSALFENVGLVSGAVWSELTGDGFPELILACEWGPLRVFRNERGVLSAWDFPVVMPPSPGAPSGRTIPLSHLTGWWNGVTVGDFDEDGRLDIAASNWGLNDTCQPSLEHPLRLFYGDLAGRGMTDLIEAYFVPELGGDAPRRNLSVLGQSFPTLALSYPTHAAFAEATTDQLLRVLRPSAKRVESATHATMLLLNRGTNFIGMALDAEAQLAPAFAIDCGDLDGDGHEDLFLSQNFFPMRSDWPRLDAGRGLCLRGDGRGKLTPISGSESGIAIYGEQRGAAWGDFDEDGRPDLVVSQNGAATRLFKNIGAKAGLRVKLKGPAGNPWGIGARIRVQTGARWGPVREIHAGSGYWSQTSPVVVMGYPRFPEKIEVVWPGGKSCTYPVPPGTLEAEVDPSGGLRATSTANR